MSGPLGEAPPLISRDEVRRGLRDPEFLLLDVLPRSSFAGNHILGAISLPASEIPRMAPELIQPMERPAAAYCSGFD